MDNRVIDNPAEHRFQMQLDGEDIAAAYYQIDENGNVVLTHTEVPFEYSGRGIGTQLATGVFDLIRASGRKAVLKCSFMAQFFVTHPQYADIVAG